MTAAPPSPEVADGSTSHALVAGVVSGLVGFTSSFAVVLAGLRAVAADSTQATSGLTVLCLAMGLGCVVFSLRTRMPITMAWSTPGAALLAATATPAGGWPAAVGAFVVTGLLLALLALVRPLARLVAAIPDELAAAMLAGVLLVLCVAPFRALAADPAVIAPVILAWLVGFVLIRRWAVPIALAVALVVMLVGGTLSDVGAGDLAPVLDVTAPVLDAGALVAIAIPLVVVTTTSQNVPGVAVLRSFGYEPDPRPPLVYAGLASAATALLGTLAASAASAFGPSFHREAAALTFVVAASGVTIAGVGGAFWGLVAGGALHVILRRRDKDVAPRS